MIKELKVVDEKNGVVRVTTADERWYFRPSKDSKTGLPEYEHIPSVTWIAGHYPKGIAFYKWLAEKGWDESQALKNAAGNKGSKVHQAIEKYLKGERINITDKFINNEIGKEEDLTTEEYECIISFVDWFDSLDEKPEILATETIVFNNEVGYAGTVDFIVRWKGSVWIIDFKTSQYIWPEYELQISAYKHANLNIKLNEGEEVRLGILQIGYKKNKNKYKFNLIEDKFELFLAAKQIWKNETEGQSPKQAEYPLYVEMKKEEPKKSVKKLIKNELSK